MLAKRTGSSYVFRKDSFKGTPMTEPLDELSDTEEVKLIFSWFINQLIRVTWSGGGQ